MHAELQAGIDVAMSGLEGNGVCPLRHSVTPSRRHADTRRTAPIRYTVRMTTVISLVRERASLARAASKRLATLSTGAFGWGASPSAVNSTADG